MNEARTAPTVEPQKGYLMHGKDVPTAARKVKAGVVDFQLIRAVAFRQAEGLVTAWLPEGRREGDEWVARNPTRADQTPGSFKVNLRTCEWSDFATADAGGDLIALRAYLDGSNQADAARKLAAELGIEGEPSTGLTLEHYAAAKQLPVDFLRDLGLETIADPWGKPRSVLAIPYRKRDGSLHRNRLRVALQKLSDAPRMFWDKREDKIGAILYGLDQLPAKGCPLILVEGESDAQTLWHHGIDAVAVPGAGNYAPGRDDPELDGYDIIAFIEPDQGGTALVKQLTKSRLRQHIKIAQLEGFKDVSALHCRAPERFEEVLKAAIAKAEPLEAPRTPDAPKPKTSSQTPDDEDRKPTLADTLVRLAREAATFFVSLDDTAYAAVEVSGHREVWNLRSRAFRSWLIHRFFSVTGRAPSADTIAQAQLTLEAVATYEGEKRLVFTRTARHDGRLYLDLGDADWRAVEIDATGWRIMAVPPVYFTRSNGALPLPEPVAGGSIDDLRPLLNLASEDDFRLIIAWLLAALRPQGPFPLLALAGEPGTSKTSTATLLRSLIDPHIAGIRRPPKEERDLFICASKSAALVYDNLSSIPEWLSDGLCVVATGGTFAARALRTDGDEALFTVEKPVMITSVGEVISRSDLADRAMVVTLTAIPEASRMTKAAFNAMLDSARPRILGALLDGVSQGLANVTQVNLQRLPRMADFITWAQACETAFWSAGTIHAAFDRNVADAVEGVLEGDAVAVALRKWFDKRDQEAWQGRTEALLGELNNWAEDGAKREKTWPRNPQALRSRLTMAAPALRKVGIVVERGARSKRERYLDIYRA
jgi:hypothetical protein